MAKPTIEELEKQLAEASEKTAKLQERKTIYMLATSIPQDPGPETKATITLHPELGYADEEHLMEKARKNRQSLKIVKVEKVA